MSKKSHLFFSFRVHFSNSYYIPLFAGLDYYLPWKLSHWEQLNIGFFHAILYKHSIIMPLTKPVIPLSAPDKITSISTSSSESSVVFATDFW